MRKKSIKEIMRSEYVEQSDRKSKVISQKSIIGKIKTKIVDIEGQIQNYSFNIYVK